MRCDGNARDGKVTQEYHQPQRLQKDENYAGDPADSVMDEEFSLCDEEQPMEHVQDEDEEGKSSKSNKNKSKKTAKMSQKQDLPLVSGDPFAAPQPNKGLRKCFGWCSRLCCIVVLLTLALLLLTLGVVMWALITWTNMTNITIMPPFNLPVHYNTTDQVNITGPEGVLPIEEPASLSPTTTIGQLPPTAINVPTFSSTIFSGNTESPVSISMPIAMPASVATMPTQVPSSGPSQLPTLVQPKHPATLIPSEAPTQVPTQHGSSLSQEPSVLMTEDTSIVPTVVPSTSPLL